MSWKALAVVSDRVIGSASRRLLLLMMADKANEDGSGVYASFGTLAQMCEMSRPTVKRMIAELEEAGLIRHVGTREHANGRTNDYTLMLDEIRKLPSVGEAIKMNRVHREPGSKEARFKSMNPVHGEPGSNPRTRFTMTPKPITSLVSNEPKDVTKAPQARPGRKTAATPAAKPEAFALQAEKPNPRGRFIDPDMALTPARREVAERIGYVNGSVDALFDAFKNHWLAAAGSKAMKRDWDAAWRTWVGNDIKFNGSPRSGKHTSQTQPADRWVSQTSRNRAAKHAGFALALERAKRMDMVEEPDTTSLDGGGEGDLRSVRAILGPGDSR